MIPYLPHATLQAHRGYDDPPCPGMLNIVEQSLSVWELECDVCHEPWSLPAGQATPEMRAQAKLEQAKRWRAQAGIPRLLRDWRFDRIGYADMKPQVLAAARAWATGEKPGLLLSGPVGVGKTTLAAAAANARLDKVSLLADSAGSALASMLSER
jgi:DNA replication protein DnaC